jgi:hypothetical protein
MPEIIVAANEIGGSEGAVMLRERINASDFESDHFAIRLLERLTWAVSDAHATEQRYRSETGARGLDQSR